MKKENYNFSFTFIVWIVLFFVLLIYSIANVKADTIQIEDSTDYNYYIDLRDNQYLIGRTLIQEGIITATCNYLSNSYGCGIQVPLTNPFDMYKDKEYTFSFLVATDNRTIQVSTWKSNLNIVSVEDSALNIGGGSKGVYRLYNYDTSENTTYNADVTISLQDSNSNIKIYKLDYKIKSKKTQKVKYFTFAFGENYNGNSTTGTLQFSYFMVDATNQEIIDSVNDLKNTLSGKIDDINDNINNTDISGANGKGKNFFDNFNTTDNGGISGIISAPLRLIKGLVSSNGTNSYTDLPMTVMGKDVALPCGKILWSKVPQGTLTIYHTIICGFGAYAILRALFKDIEDLKNPNNSEVKTTDL